jgi:hypothetical protein
MVEKGTYFVGDANAGFGDPAEYRRQQDQKREDAKRKDDRPLVGGWTDGAEPPRTPAPKGQEGGFANETLAD